ncbi:MAG: hypothetical protein CMD34_06120, partial [Flavobacteriales bacterium]|nr:hypothetical protein [Flavobacteriales bacterium]
IRAENNDAISLLPERAEYEFYEYSTISGFVDNYNVKTKNLIKITDLLGKNLVDLKDSRNVPVFFIFDDGSVEKKIILD